MDSQFWHNRWHAHEIGFHLEQANPLLAKHFKRLGLAPGSRVFIPLCGKTRDIAWLLSQGHHVAGVELVELAIVELFDELGVKPQVKTIGTIKQYSAPQLDILVGDIFLVTSSLLGPVDAVYDRAALVALPPGLRRAYTAHLTSITHARPQLLITYEYDQALMPGPPFSVDAQEVREHYPRSKLLDAIDVPGGLKGKWPAKESTWLIPNLFNP